MSPYSTYKNKRDYFVDWVLFFIGQNPRQYTGAGLDAFIERHKKFFDALFEEADADADFDIHHFCVRELYIPGGKFRGEFEGEK